MKAIKNKKRFDPRWHHEERLESKEQDLNEINEIKVNFNSFNLDTWLEEEAAKEKEYPPTQPKRAPKDERDLDAEMANLKPGEEIRRGEHPLVEDPNEGCGDPEMGPEEAEPAITDLSPDEAFGAGYSAAVEEIMASIQGLLGDPMDMTSPEEMERGDEEMVVQLPDHAMEMHEEAKTTVHMIRIKPEAVKNLSDESRKTLARGMATTLRSSNKQTIEDQKETWLAIDGISTSDIEETSE
jgi:hypothetical protein